MRHLVCSFGDTTIAEGIQDLYRAHDFLVACSVDAIRGVPEGGPQWGCQMKRLWVLLPLEGRPSLVAKDRERFGEVVNMVATLERLLAVLGWFDERPEFRQLRIAACHPSTSSASEANDLVLSNAGGEIAVRCEVSDVAAGVASQNGKELKDLASLGCAEGVPRDGIRRFLCTSPEFASAIQSGRRKWALRGHRYRPFLTGEPGGTVLLEVHAADDL
jgi:hypothetical protein